MWIEQITDKECDNLYVAVAHNPRNGQSMEMSNPRTSYHETLNWVRGYCGTFSILPAWLMMTQTTLTFEEIDALLKFIEFHTDSFTDEESAEELNELVGCDVDALYNKLSEMQDEV